MAGQLGSTYAIAIIYVPILMITHVAAFYWCFARETASSQQLQPRNGGFVMTDQPLAQTQSCATTTTGVFALLKARPGVKRDQIMATMPAEIRATVQLYLASKIREWYSREDGRGGVFLLNA